MIYQRNDYVPASMCDGGVKLSLIAVFQLVQDAGVVMPGEVIYPRLPEKSNRNTENARMNHHFPKTVLKRF